MSVLTRSGFATSNGLAPDGEPRTVYIEFDFASFSEIQFDLSAEESTQQLTSVQSCFIDNSSNPLNFRMRVTGTQQRIICPARWQGVFPLYALNGMFHAIASVDSPVAGANTSIILANIPQPYAAWPARGANLGIARKLAASPLGATMPAYRGELVQDQSTGYLWMAADTTNTGWVTAAVEFG